MASKSEVLALLDKLQVAKTDVDWFCRAFACTQCGAAVGQPCKPRGPQHKTHPWHLTRQDSKMRSSSKAALVQHREDLARGVAPSQVLAALQKLTLYKLALRDGLLLNILYTGSLSGTALSKFFDEKFEFVDGAGAALPRATVRRMYELWCSEVGEQHPLSHKAFTAACRRVGLVEKVTRGLRSWEGLRVRDGRLK